MWKPQPSAGAHGVPQRCPPSVVLHQHEGKIVRHWLHSSRSRAAGVARPRYECGFPLLGPNSPTATTRPLVKAEAEKGPLGQGRCPGKAFRKRLSC